MTDTRLVPAQAPTIELRPVQPPIDFSKPDERFQLRGLARFDGVLRAIMYDLKESEQLQVAEGDTLADSGYRLDRIDFAKHSVYLRGPHLDTVKIPLHKQPLR